VLERIHKVMARAGVASRRRCEELVAAGRVTVNGKVVPPGGVLVDAERDRIEVDGQPLGHPDERVYFLVNKPVGYVTTMHDPDGRPTVADLIRGVGQRVFPVGRLDYDTEGLLLMTNDGDLANALAHPRHHVDKTYVAVVQGVPGRDKLRRLEQGIDLDGRRTAPAKAKLLGTNGGRAIVEVTIHEGRYRQVRRMLEAIGHPVIALQRRSIGPLTVDGLKPGHFRPLNSVELEALRKLTAGKLPVAAGPGESYNRRELMKGGPDRGHHQGPNHRRSPKS